MNNAKSTLRNRAALALILLGAFGSVHAQDWQKSNAGDCSNATLNGDYGFRAQGATLAGAPVPDPLLGAFASTGVSHFDGRGRFTLSATASFNGVIQPAETRGTYQVNSDCTYTSKADNGTGFRAVIVDGGRDILILQTDPGTVIAGTARKQRPVPHTGDGERRSGFGCSDKTIRGSYGFLAEGIAGPPTLPLPSPGPLAGVGTVRFQPGGDFLLIATRSVSGMLDPEPLSLKGTYSVEPDCRLNMTFEVGFTFKAAITDGGEQIDFVETDPGTALLVNAKRI